MQITRKRSADSPSTPPPFLDPNQTIAKRLQSLWNSETTVRSVPLFHRCCCLFTHHLKYNPASSVETVENTVRLIPFLPGLLQAYQCALKLPTLEILAVSKDPLNQTRLLIRPAAEIATLLNLPHSDDPNFYIIQILNLFCTYNQLIVFSAHLRMLPSPSCPPFIDSSLLRPNLLVTLSTYALPSPSSPSSELLLRLTHLIPCLLSSQHASVTDTFRWSAFLMLLKPKIYSVFPVNVDIFVGLLNATSDLFKENPTEKYKEIANLLRSAPAPLKNLLNAF